MLASSAEGIVIMIKTYEEFVIQEINNNKLDSECFIDFITDMSDVYDFIYNKFKHDEVMIKTYINDNHLVKKITYYEFVNNFYLDSLLRDETINMVFSEYKSKDKWIKIYCQLRLHQYNERYAVYCDRYISKERTTERKKGEDNNEEI